jgi:spore maturation protein CgeB
VGPLADAWREFPQLWQLNRVAQSPLYGLRMYEALRDSRITLNFHIDAAKGRAANFRLFEATGAGACLVTDWQKDLNDYFDVDREVVAFHSFDECVEKVRYLLDHESERAAIAKRGQERTLRDHRLDQAILAAGQFLLDRFC